jgi:hypothetical protein
MTMRTGMIALLVLLIMALTTIPFALAGEEKVPLDKLPKEVVQAVTSKFPKAKMESAVKATADGKTSYEVTLKAGKFGIDVTVTPAGKIVQIEKEMALADLPKPVAAAFSAKYPKLKVKRIEELIKEDKIISYELLIEAAEKTLEAYFDPQGKFLQEKDVTPKKVENEGKGPKVWSFDKDEIGKPPSGFEFAVTAKKQPGTWVIAKDGKNLVLAQTDRDKTPRRFAMALVKDMKFKNVRLSVKAKVIAGDVESVAGLVWRYQDADNYYVARWNHDSVRVDRVVKGERQLLPKRELEIKLDPKLWHVLKVEHRGDKIKVFVDDKMIFEGNDKAYQEGQIGLWIKADSLTYFDDLMVEELKE